MRKFKIDFETIKYPLIVMLIMFLFRGISNTVLSDGVIVNIDGNFKWIIGLMSIIQYFSTMVIQYLPFLFVVMYLSKRYNSSKLVLMFFVSFLLISTITAIYGSHNLPAIAYATFFKIDSLSYFRPGNVEVILKPYRIGFFASLISGVIVAFSYRWTNARTKYALFQFIDKNVLGIIYVIVLSFIMGLFLSVAWPFVIKYLFLIFDWIAEDITNPLHTLIYGFFDKILSLFELSALNRETFWYSSLGGSWMSNAGVNYLGDVSIWQATLSNEVFSGGFGRYLTPYYIINLFAIPGYIIGLFSLYTDKRERYNNIILASILIAFTFVADLSVPVEILMFVIAPLLYAFHLAVSSLIFGALHGMGLFLGSVFPDGLAGVTLGNGFEFVSYFKNHNLRSTLVTLIIIGIVILIIYIFATRLYYRYLAIGLINKFDIEAYVDELDKIVGGISNIEEINSSPFRLSVKLKRPQMFDYEFLETTDIGRVKETRTMYSIYYGTASTIIRQEVLLRKQLQEDEF